MNIVWLSLSKVMVLKAPVSLVCECVCVCGVCGFSRTVVWECYSHGTNLLIFRIGMIKVPLYSCAWLPH